MYSKKLRDCDFAQCLENSKCITSKKKPPLTEVDCKEDYSEGIKKDLHDLLSFSEEYDKK